MGNEYSRNIKYKRLQVAGKLSKSVIIPFPFLQELKWNKSTKLAVVMHPLDREIVIREVGKWEDKLDVELEKLDDSDNSIEESVEVIEI